MKLITDRSLEVTTLDRARLARAKRSFVTRRLDAGEMCTLLRGDLAPEPGDLVLARVVRLRQHQKLETVHGRRALMFPGDEIVVAYGNRYAPDQFEALVPGNLGPAHLVASGGIASRVREKHDDVRAATEIEPLGLIGDATAQRVNVRRGALELRPAHTVTPTVIAVVGAAMNAGKTTMAGSLVHGLARAGLRVGATKVTGTGSGCDVWRLQDSGAERVLDFTDAGHASTYLLDTAEVVRTATGLVGALAACDVVVVEVADGVFQRETAELLGAPEFARLVDGFLFACGDALAADAGVRWMREHGLPLVALGGRITQSPLAMREARERAGVPILGTSDLVAPDGALFVLSSADSGRRVAAG